MEYPEGQHRSFQVMGNVLVGAFEKIDDTRKIIRVTDICRAVGFPLDVLQHQHALIGVHDRWRNSGRVRGTACRAFVKTQYAVQRNIIAKARHEPLRSVANQKIAIRHAARERLRIDLTRPTGQGRDARNGFFRSHAARKCQAFGRQKVCMP